MSDETLKKTALFESHKKWGGKMVPFAGWHMPVEYEGLGLRKEHEATRKSIGLFDVSHMGEIVVRGKQSLDFLQKLLTNDVAKCVEGQAQYNMMLNKSGGVVDDLIVYCQKHAEDYFVVVNASNKNKDFKWMKEQATEFSDLQVIDESHLWSQIAVQGPAAVSLVNQIFPASKEISKFKFSNLVYQGQKWLVARTGYTGEDGFEIYGANENAAAMWEVLMEQGKEFGITPCGLGARNTLRIEAALPLYGNELLEEQLPLNIGMNWALKLNKEAKFNGQDILVDAKEKKVFSKNLVALLSDEKAIPRDGYKVFGDEEQEIGYVTSGTFSPSLEKPIAMAMLDSEYKKQTCLIQIRNRYIKANIEKLPFLKKQ